MPNASALWMAVGTLWLMDSSINISMEPFRALVGDLLPDEQRTTGFAAQTFFIGIGAVVASLLPYIFTNYLNVSNTAGPGEIPPSVRYSFYIGGAAFFSAVLWTVLRTREYPPVDLPAFEEEKRRTAGFANGFRESFLGIFQMPKTMRQLAIVQFFSWLALFSMWIYTTQAVTSHIYHATDTTSKINKKVPSRSKPVFHVSQGEVGADGAAATGSALPTAMPSSSSRSARSPAATCTVML